MDRQHLARLPGNLLLVTQVALPQLKLIHQNLGSAVFERQRLGEIIARSTERRSKKEGLLVVCYGLTGLSHALPDDSQIVMRLGILRVDL